MTFTVFKVFLSSQSKKELWNIFDKAQNKRIILTQSLFEYIAKKIFKQHFTDLTTSDALSWYH